jgi:hypothetical protein
MSEKRARARIRLSPMQAALCAMKLFLLREQKVQSVRPLCVLPKRSNKKNAACICEE